MKKRIKIESNPNGKTFYYPEVRSDMFYKPWMGLHRNSPDSIITADTNVSTGFQQESEARELLVEYEIQEGMKERITYIKVD